MLTVYDLLILIEASVRSTSDIKLRGIGVYNVLSSDLLIAVLINFKSVTLRLLPVGSLPWATPVTVVTPTTSTEVVATLTTLAKLGSGFPLVSVNCKISSTLTNVPGKIGFVLLTTLLPVEALYGVIVAIPILANSVWMVSALNVLANPTSDRSGPPYTDFTSANP